MLEIFFFWGGGRGVSVWRKQECRTLDPFLDGLSASLARYGIRTRVQGRGLGHVLALSEQHNDDTHEHTPPLT